MTTMSRVFQGLCRAIDQGDRSALIVLADYLEETADPCADGLRMLVPEYVPLSHKGGRAAWYKHQIAPHLRKIPWGVDGSLILQMWRQFPEARLPGQERPGQITGVMFGSQSAAYLALAEALSMR